MNENRSTMVRGAVWRDVMNRTSNDLAVPENDAELKALLKSVTGEI